MLSKLPPNLLDDLVAANRILFHQGVFDAFGHVSVRDPREPGVFHMARNVAPARVQREDILAYDVGTGEAWVAGSPKGYLERHIHSGIYRTRPDVGAVVHSHASAVVAFSVSRSARLRPVCHMSGFLGHEGPPLFDLRDIAGDASDLLVRDAATGDALARRLGAASVVLMRGHGCTVVGPGLRQAVFKAVYTQTNAALLAQALALGDDVIGLTEGEARASAVHETQVDRPWELWKQQAAGALA